MRVAFRKGVQGAAAMKQGADASSFGPGGWRDTYLVLSVWVSSALSAQRLASRAR